MSENQVSPHILNFNKIFADEILIKKANKLN